MDVLQCLSHMGFPLPHAEQAADAGRDVREPRQPERHRDEDVRAEPAGQGLLQRHHDDAAAAPTTASTTAATAATTLRQRARSAATRNTQGRMNSDLLLSGFRFISCYIDEGKCSKCASDFLYKFI